MPEGSLSVAKVISTTLKKIRYGRKMNSRKDLDNEKMEVRNVIERQEIELQRCWEGKLVFVLHNVFTKKVKTFPIIIMTLLYVHCDCMNNFWKTIELACNCLNLYRFSYQEHALFIYVCLCFAGMLTNDKRFWTKRIQPRYDQHRWWKVRIVPPSTKHYSDSFPDDFKVYSSLYKSH